jgi:probable rRNA maturation factor
MSPAIALMKDIEHPAIPDNSEIVRAVSVTFRHAGISLHQGTYPEICIRFADNASVREMNRNWRHQDAVTDVLSFPMQDQAPFRADEPLGDIILALPFVLEEAERLNLAPGHHILHLIIHGTLHLLGFDHIDDEDAHTMQGLEVAIMQQLGLHHPYDPSRF